MNILKTEIKAGFNDNPALILKQFMSESAEILIFKQSNSLQRIVQLSDAFRQVCSGEQGQIFSLGNLYWERH